MQEDEQTNNLQINIQSKSNKQLRRKQQNEHLFTKEQNTNKMSNWQQRTTSKQTNNKTIIQANTHQNS